jgi:hypothetical protein
MQTFFFMKHLHLYYLCTLVVLLLTSCGEVREVSLSEEQTNLNKVHIYLDNSMSMKGFFNVKNSEAIRFIGNMNTDLEKKGIARMFYKFNTKCDTVSRVFSAFSSSALVSEESDAKKSDTKQFYDGKNNVFSVPLDTITKSIQLNTNEVHIILTDAVLSPTGGNIAKEIADIQYVLAGYTNLAGSNISIYQFRYQFAGTYYAQPSDTPVEKVNTKRNFYAIVLASQKYTALIDELMLNNECVNYQHLNNALKSVVVLDNASAKQTVLNNRIDIKLLPKSNSNAWADSTVKALAKSEWVLIDQEKKEKKIIPIEQDTTESVLRFKVDLAKAKIDSTFTVCLKKPNFLLNCWDSLDYKVESEPTNASLDHSKTFGLNNLLKAFHYLYKDKYALEYNFAIQSSIVFSPMLLYTIVLPEQQGTKLQKSLLYWILLVIALLPILVAFHFYQTEDPSERTVKLQKSWLLRGLMSMLGVAILSAATLAIFSPPCTDCEGSVSVGILLLYTGYNAIFSFVLPYFGMSLFLRAKAQVNLRSVPF